MPIRIVQLGTPRATGEGLRIGTVRRPPRGVPKTEFASRNYYDVWYPELSPEPELMDAAQAAVKLLEAGDAANTVEGTKQWKVFDKQFRKQLAEHSVWEQRVAEARTEFEAAASLTPNEAQQAVLRGKAAALPPAL